jgi:hypothetical protein
MYRERTPEKEEKRQREVVEKKLMIFKLKIYIHRKGEEAELGINMYKIKSAKPIE